VPIPDLLRTGLLPEGVHECSLEEIRLRFTWNDHRISLYARFLDFFRAELRPAFLDPVFLDGSFVTDKELPDDTDVVLDLTAATDARKLQGLRFLQHHQIRVKAQYAVHFWINLPGMNDFSEFFQYVGVKTARMKGIDPRHLKGILRIP
jgi:hypothetical protein